MESHREGIANNVRKAKRIIQRLIKRFGQGIWVDGMVQDENSAKLCTSGSVDYAGQYSVVKLRNTGREFNLNILLGFFLDFVVQGREGEREASAENVRKIIGIIDVT